MKGRRESLAPSPLGPSPPDPAWAGRRRTARPWEPEWHDPSPIRAPGWSAGILPAFGAKRRLLSWERGRLARIRREAPALPWERGHPARIWREAPALPWERGRLARIRRASGRSTKENHLR